MTKQLDHQTEGAGAPCSRCGLRYSPKTAYIMCFVQGDTLETWVRRQAQQLLAAKDHIPALLVEMAEESL